MNGIPAAECSFRQSALLALAVLFLVFLAGTASANPPSDMKVSYSQLTSDLSVTITHPVAGVKEHYIKEVTVTVNGNLINDSFYTSQPGDVFTYDYPLALNPGDAVVVTATCSITGTGSRTFIMPGPTATVPETEKAPVPAAFSLAALAALLALRRQA